MKTADTIEEQEERKDARGDGKSGGKDGNHSTHGSGPGSEKKRRGNVENLKPWPKGVSGNPAGRVKNDIAAQIARACFEGDPEMLRQVFTKALKRGNAYCFKELADRAYGKIKEKIEVDTNPLRDMSEEALTERIHELEKQLGYVPQPADDSTSTKPN